MADSNLPPVIVVLCTVPREDIAADLARMLVERRLAACVNVVPGLRSFYRWQGETQDDREALLVIKTRRDLFDDLARTLAGEHPYDVPEVVALPVDDCHRPYWEWLVESVG
ncbi:MAG: divalent-cation tolerance protein CutA [Acidobacteria bacterium]|nr:MAG: divalent-cation tolerance protein CutA [Acidobacteriota bacterium]